MNKIGIVYNPFAGSNKCKKERYQNLARILGNRGIIRKTSSLQELTEVAREFYEEKISILALSGGDGSNHFALTTFQKVYKPMEFPYIAFLRGGTMNLLENSLNMKGSPEIRLKKLVEMVDSGNCSTIPHTLLCVNGKYGYIFGNGVVANFLKEYYQGGNTGLRKAVSVFAKAFWAGLWGKPYIDKIFAPVKANLQVGDTLLPDTKFTVIMAATEVGCGLGFKPFYRARKEVGKFQILAATDLKPLEVIQNLPRFHSGKKVESPNLYDFVTDHALLETFEHYYYTIDGEMLNSTKRIEISSGPVVQIMAIY